MRTANDHGNGVRSDKRLFPGAGLTRVRGRFVVDGTLTHKQSIQGLDRYSTAKECALEKIYGALDECLQVWVSTLWRKSVLYSRTACSKWPYSALEMVTLLDKLGVVSNS
jgi:hypothetical protein